uniref:Uncharacterized protein n=1 Tax=Knipowitschia caucasica TaxID=637954 RepID=A0AAV2MN21_KNICA
MGLDAGRTTAESGPCPAVQETLQTVRTAGRRTWSCGGERLVFGYLDWSVNSWGTLVIRHGGLADSGNPRVSGTSPSLGTWLLVLKWCGGGRNWAHGMACRLDYKPVWDLSAPGRGLWNP